MAHPLQPQQQAVLQAHPPKAMQQALQLLCLVQLGQTMSKLTQI
jgi:hypothetical protein